MVFVGWYSWGTDGGGKEKIVNNKSAESLISIDDSFSFVKISMDEEKLIETIKNLGFPFDKYHRVYLRLVNDESLIEGGFVLRHPEGFNSYRYKVEVVDSNLEIFLFINDPEILREDFDGMLVTAIFHSILMNDFVNVEVEAVDKVIKRLVLNDELKIVLSKK